MFEAERAGLEDLAIQLLCLGKMSLTMKGKSQIAGGS